MPKFRKKSLVVEAMRATAPMVIKTSKGDRYVEAGDWVITGIMNEQYPVDHPIFLLSYDPENEEAIEYLKKMGELEFDDDNDDY